MLHIGCHLSTAKGYAHMGETALEIGANTFQYFTRNPRGSGVKKVDEEDMARLRELMKENSFAPILAHAPYTQNACSKEEGLRNLARDMMSEDVARMEAFLPRNLYNFHPGSHVGQGIKTGICQIQRVLNAVITQKQTTMILLETMSGKGTEIGGKFEELAEIIKGVNIPEKVGVCMDMCHVYAAGYDIVQNLDRVFAEFDKVVGLKRLYAIHLNDSMMPLGSHKDRHAKIGEGAIGLKGIVSVMTHSAVKDLPFYLETPNEVDGYAKEIALLKKKVATASKK